MNFIFPNKPIRIYDIPKLLATLSADRWLVQPKWDGKRAHVACDATGKITLYGRQGQLFKEDWAWLSRLPFPRPWFTDGELLRDGRMFIWDFAIWDGQEKFRYPYNDRLTTLQSIFTSLNHNEQTISLIETFPIHEYQTVLSRGKQNNLEGVVFKDRMATNLWGPFSTTEVNTQFKYRL